MSIRSFIGVVAAFALTSVSAIAGITLKSIQFPSTLGGKSGTTNPPSQAPLSQEIHFVFSGKPKIGPGIESGVKIAVSSLNSDNQPVGQLAFGKFTVKGKRLVFTPRLPTGPLPDSFGPTTDIAANASLPGLLPGTTYQVSVELTGGNAIKNYSKTSPSLSLPVLFTTAPTSVGSIGTAGFYAFATTKAPTLLKKNGVAPKSKTTGLHPNVLFDPAGVFASIPTSKKAPYTLRFGAPLNPENENVLERIRLRAILDASAVPVDIALPISIVLTENVPTRSTVLVYPNGTLPLGHTLALEVSDLLENISGAFANDGSTPEAFKEVARYVVTPDPSPGMALDGEILETFETNEREDTSIVASGKQLASWNGQTSGALRASFGFGGDGSLGAFAAPTAGTLTITLDTDFQTFPLLSGATPGAEPGTIVKGGVFKFTDFHLPANATLRAVGSNPLVITATGDVLIEGVIECSGSNGIGDDTFNSAVTPAPGGAAGPGGGKGGDGHPVFVPKGAKSLIYMITPQFGQNGFGTGNKLPIGGGGGQSGATLPWPAFSNGANCATFNEDGDGSRGSGGGGGSLNVFLPEAPEPITVPVSGRRGGFGIGNHLPLSFSPGLPFPVPNNPKAYDGVSFNAVARPNPNPTFAEAVQQGLIFDAAVGFNLTTSWALTKRITFGGSPGQAVFADADANNNFIGEAGEVKSIIGGQGGGGGGSRTEGLSLDCTKATLSVGFPLTVLDAKGAGGGGGGGAVMIQALGEIRIKGTAARIRALGGNGSGGETTQGGDVGGNGGGGSGGSVLLQSAENVVMESTANPNVVNRVIDVSAGCGFNAFILLNGATGTSGADSGSLQVGDGAPGGPGIVQVQVPVGVTPTLFATQIGARVWKSLTNPPKGINCPFSTSSLGNSEFIDVLVPTNKTPVPFTSKSSARSTWYDLGLISPPFRPLVNTTAGAIAGPVFGVPGDGPIFQGTDPNTGLVEVDGSGNVLNSFDNDFDVDAPDLGVPDFLPQGVDLQTVSIKFQGANDDPLNPGFPDLTTASAFVTDPTTLNGFRYIRYEIEFNIAAAVGVVPTPSTARPQMNFLRIPFKY